MIDTVALAPRTRVHTRALPAAGAKLTAEIRSVVDSYVRAGGAVTVIDEALIVSLQGPRAAFATWKWRFAGSHVEKEFCGRDPAKTAYCASFGDVSRIEQRAHSIDSLSVLPSSDLSGFLRFVQESGLAALHPAQDWHQVFATYGRERAAAPFTLEVVAPGLTGLAAELRRRGGEVGFNTMRPEAERWSTRR